MEPVEVVLDQATEGDLAHQHNAKIVKSNNDQVVYFSNYHHSALPLNTMDDLHAPRAGSTI